MKKNKLPEINNKIISKADSKCLYNKSTFANGLNIVTEEIPGVESIALGIAINAGSRDDFKDKEGLAHFMEHIVYRHTKTKNSRQIAEGFESVGAYANAFTTQEHTCFYVRTLTKHFNKTFKLLADLALNPIFREKDIEKERAVIIEEIRSSYDDPEEYIFDLGDNTIFEEHPLGNPIQGFEETVEKITSDDLREFHDKYYHPSNFTIIAVGNINHKKTVEISEKFFKSFGKKNSLERLPIPEILSEKEYSEELPISQSHLLFGKKISSFSSVERYPLLLLNTLLGDGMSSRLYQRLREKNGIAYSIYSTINYYSDCGVFYIYVATDKTKLKKSENLIFQELNKLREKISLPNLKKAKEQLKSALIMDMENLTTRMISIIKDELILKKRESMEDVINSIDNVTLEQIQIIASYYFSNENWMKISVYPDKKQQN